MLSFKQFVDESQQWGSDRAKRSKEEEMQVAKMSPIFNVFSYQGWKFQSSVHAAAQAYDRRPDFELDDWKRMHRNVMHGLKSVKALDGEYLFFSKSADQAYIAAVNAKQKLIKIVTVLPKGKSFPKPGTDKLIVEGVEYFYEELVVVD